MKLVVAVIQPQQLPAVKEALFEAQVRHLTCTNVLGTATAGAEPLVFRGVPHKVTLFQRVRLELALKDEMVDRATEAIVRGAEASGGFGIIFVTELDEVINITTRARGERAV